MQKLAGLKTVGLGGLRATFEGSLFMFWGPKKYCRVRTKKRHKMKLKKHNFFLLKLIMIFKQELPPQNSRYTPLLCLHLAKARPG